MDLTNLEKTLKTEPSFRLKQAKKAVFVNLIDDWNKATGLPAILREKLNKECPLAINANTLESKDKQTAKAVIILKDGLKIESVLMRHRDGRNTICVSSQVGCALGCAFCLTGKKGFKRNLEPMEIVEQVLFFARYLKISQVSLPSLDEEGAGGGADKNPKHHPTLILPSTEGRRNQRIDNVVFMGMGEPFLNFGNVMQAIKILNDKDSLNIGARHISISTAGIIEGIEKLAKQLLQINLAISLHAPNNKLRSRLMPINKKYPIEKVLAAVLEYILKTRRKVMFEYIMIDKLNDSDGHAKELILMIKNLKNPLCFVNLISYNPTGDFKPSSPQRIKRFKEILEKENISVTERHRFGKEIKGACGQLAE